MQLFLAKKGVKNPEIIAANNDFGVARREGFEPPAFWSVGCLKGKSEPFRLRFVLFATVRSADLPLFPSSPARSNSILGQKWVRENFEITKQKLSSVCPIYFLSR